LNTILILTAVLTGIFGPSHYTAAYVEGKPDPVLVYSGAPETEITSPLAEEAPKKTTEQLIIEAFGREKPFVKIADCESNLRQFEDNGEVRRGRLHSPDTGLFQINKKVWGETAEKLNLDIETLEGNIKMAKVVYDTQGLQAWKASQHCWDKK
jgi:hypothetical protein